MDLPTPLHVILCYLCITSLLNPVCLGYNLGLLMRGKQEILFWPLLRGGNDGFGFLLVNFREKVRELLDRQLYVWLGVEKRP